MLVRSLRPPRTGNQHTTPDNPTATGPSSLLRISRRLPASSSFVLAAARLRALQLDPWPRGEKTPGSCEEGSRRTVSPSPGGAHSHRVRFVRPLDNGGPYGCRIEDDVRTHAYALTGMFTLSLRADQRPRQSAIGHRCSCLRNAERRLQAAVQRLRAAGVRMHIDQFCTSHSRRAFDWSASPTCCLEGRDGGRPWGCGQVRHRP